MTIDAENMSDDTSNNDNPGPEQHDMDKGGSDDQSSSEEEEESELVLDKKVGSRKPSKRVLETATNEVSAIDSQCDK